MGKTQPNTCIRAIAGEVVKLRSVHLINFCGGGQVIGLKFATALMCAESNDRLKVVTQLFTRWWNRPTGVVLSTSTRLSTGLSEGLHFGQ